MKKLTKQIILPDGRQVKLTAIYRTNYDEVRPDIEGPFNDLIALAGYRPRPEISATEFDGWMQRRLDAAGCKVDNSDDGGTWEVFRE